MAFDKSELAKYSVTEILEYGLFDKYGSLVGAKEDSPVDFKEAYEHDKKIHDDALKKGVVL